MNDGIQSVIDAIERSGRFFKLRNGEINTRCPMCGDSVHQYHAHLYISTEPNHVWFCQRCGAKGSHLTSELLESLGCAEREAVAYARAVMKSERRNGGRRKGSRLAAGESHLILPLPDRNIRSQKAAISYLENRLGLELEDREIQRYKVVSSLYAFLDANEIMDVTIAQREADRLDETCVGFLSADESYIIFRSLDEERVARGGSRYTNFRVWTEWEGSKLFLCRHNVDLLSPRHTVVLCEGVLDLIGTERRYYAERRWEPDYIGAACCGSAHGAALRQLVGLGLLSLDVDLHADREPGMMKKLDGITSESPFFQTPGFKMTVYQNQFDMSLKKEDFGVPAAQMRRVQVRL
jgi:hypothetical protein